MDDAEFLCKMVERRINEELNRQFNHSSPPLHVFNQDKLDIYINDINLVLDAIGRDSIQLIEITNKAMTEDNSIIHQIMEEHIHCMDLEIMMSGSVKVLSTYFKMNV